MNLVHLFSCLVPPGKNAEIEEKLRGARLPLSGSLFAMLTDVFIASEQECTTPIRFRMAQDGTQQNDARNEIIRLLREPSLDKALALAQRLYRVTTHKSGLGLLFLMLGEDGINRRLVVSRFPANQGVLAEAQSDTLEVEFVERVFMKNAATYKAALYEGRSFDEHFWDAMVVDKQMHDKFADYWIKGFLSSEFRTTGPAGSRRIAIALRDAARDASSLDIKQEIVAATSLIPRLNGSPVSVASLFERFSLSGATRAVLSHISRESSYSSLFSI